LDPMPLSELETPCVIVDRGKLTANIQQVQALADQAGVALRPHAKTHKCLEIARMQMEAGAVGLTVATPAEALAFLQGGIRDLTLARPLVDPARLTGLLDAARMAGARLAFTADSARGVEALDAAARRVDRAAPVFIKVDVGFRRCGVMAHEPRLLELLAAVDEAPRLDLAGLLSHPGQVYQAADAREARAVSELERALLLAARDRAAAAGLELRALSAGSTPTVLAAERFDGLTELRPGNYVFLDLTPLNMGLVERPRLALSVLSTVISANAEYAIIDAGSKRLSSDTNGRAQVGDPDLGLAFPVDEDVRWARPAPIVRLSEEHGWVRRADRRFAVGDRLRVLPRHACAVTHLASTLHVASGDRIIARWSVVARG
jgi:D-serine deaminase-like pyridoxal phosphate-dependent protein